MAYVDSKKSLQSRVIVFDRPSHISRIRGRFVSVRTSTQRPKLCWYGPVLQTTELACVGCLEHPR